MTEVVDIGLVPVPRDGEPIANAQVSGGEPAADPDRYDLGLPSARQAFSTGDGGGVCAAYPCNRRLPPQTGPGRRRLYCSATCRKRAGNRAPAPRPAPPRQPVGEFGRRLRAAIEDSGLKLATISRRLDLEDGVTVTPSTISNWQNGRVPRRGPEEDKRIFGLERVLGLRSSELLLLLGKEQAANVTPLVRERPRSRPHDDIDGFRASIDRRGGTSGYVTTAVSDTVVIGANRRENVRTVRQTIRAVEADRVDCCWGFYSTDTINSIADVKVNSGCRMGRFVIEGEMLAVELLFDRVLPLGGSHTFEFSVYPHGAPEPVVRRGTGTTALEELDMTVRFEVQPNIVWLAEWPTRTGQPQRRKARLLGGAVRLSHRRPIPGYYGVEWTW